MLLFLLTGSVVLPIKALALNALSLTAVFGVLVSIFQDGHLAGLLGFTPGPTDVSMILLIFCIAFGLSMDYEVFLLARIKEAHDAGADTVEAVATGLARTGRIVTTAAALLAITFFAFGHGTGQLHPAVRHRHRHRHRPGRHRPPRPARPRIRAPGRTAQLVVAPGTAPPVPANRASGNRPARRPARRHQYPGRP
jgi:MMPL family